MASHHSSLIGNAELGHAAAAAAAAAANAQETKGQDLQHAVDFYQKGMEIAHNSSTYDDYCRAIEHFSLAIAIRNTQPRFFLARGNAFRSINEYEHAAKDYGMAIALDDRSPLYYANRGGCYRKLNQPIAALEDLTAAIEMDVKKGNHYFNRALVLYEAGFYREAIIDFSRTLEEGAVGGIGSRIEYRALQSRGNCYRRLGNLAKGIDDLENAIKIDSRNSTGFNYLAQAYYERGDYDRAIEQYTHAIEFNNVNASYYSHRGLCYYRKGEDFARNCLADFNHSIKLDGKDPQAYFYRGSMRLWLALDLLAANAVAQAQQQAHTSGASSTSASGRSATTTAPSGTPTTSTVAQSAEKSSVAPTLTLSAQDIATEANGGLSMSSLGFLTADEQLEAAFSDIEMAWTLCPTGTQYQIGMAMITQLKKQHHEASTLFDEISDLDRTQVVVKYHLALSRHMLDEHEKALALLTDAIDALPDEPLFFEARGLLLQELQLHPLAISDFTRAIELNPDNPVNLYLRSESFLRLEKFTDTVADCTSALNRGYTSDLSVYNARGMAYRGLNEYDKALADISVCLSKAPGNDIFHFHRGVCYMECGRYADALPDLHAAVNQNQRDTKMLYFIGLCYYHEKEPKECRRFLQLALRSKPPKEILPDLYVLLALYAVLVRSQSLIHFFSPRLLGAYRYYHIGISYALENCNINAIENFTFALEHLSSLSASEDDHIAETAPPALLSVQLLYVHERAKALQLEKYFEEAIDDFNFVIRHNPNNVHAYFRRGFAHKSLGNLQDAASDFETAKLLDPTNLKLVVNYKEIKDTECIVLCAPDGETSITWLESTSSKIRDRARVHEGFVMGNACSGCCSWIFPRDGLDKDGKRSKTMLMDDENSWFEQDTVPLMSARYDDDQLESDCIITKTVVMRSPRATSATPTSTVSKSSKSIAHHDRSKSGGGSSRSSKLKKPPSRGLICVDKSDDEQETVPIPNLAHTQSQERKSNEKPRRHQSDHVVERSSSSDSSSESRDSLSSSSKYVVVQHEKQDDDQSEVKVENAEVDHDKGATSSSPRSSVKSPKGSSTSGSPKRARYGRKNYRANSSRKKNE